MARRPKHTFTFAPEALDHLEAIEPKHHPLIQEAIDEQLTFTPLDEMRNRKPLDQPAPFEAAWEMRCGPANRFRIFYEVDSQERIVTILAIAVKDRNRLRFGGEELPAP